MALEFALLLLTLCYVSTFSLHDVRRLLNRPQVRVRVRGRGRVRGRVRVRP